MSVRRPGWPELAIGLCVLLVLEIGLARIAFSMHLSDTTLAVFMSALSAVVAGGGFAAAVLLRIRRAQSFGVIRTSRNWIVVGIAGGIAVTVLKIPATMVYTALFGQTTTGQEGWSTASSGGVAAVTVSFLLLGVLTPIGEELFFRGVVTTVLLRYGAIAGVFGSTLVFALMHGKPLLMVSAVLVGLPAAELRRRTGSVWPGIALHITFDSVSSIGLFIIVPALTH